MSDEQVSNGLTWLIEQQKDEIAELERQLKISQECRDGWQWVKDKLIACVPELTLPQRDDSLAGTKYEVMGWMHVLCGYAQSANHTYLSIAVEQQKRAEEAEVEIHRLTARLAEVEAEKASIVEGLHREIIAACQNCAAGNEPSPTAFTVSRLANHRMFKLAWL